MKLMNGLCKALTAAGLNFFLMVALVSALTAQTRIESTPSTPVAAEDQENFKSPEVTKAPVQLQLPVALAKMASAASSRQVTTPAAGLVTIMSENFEGDFPTGSWMVGPGEYTWAKRNCKAHGGTFSAWMVGGGTSGSALACGANYPDNFSTIMIYGPFNLSDANYAAFSFFVFLNSESGADRFSFLASDDGTNFSGISLSGNTNGAWIPYSLALTAVPKGNTVANFTGKPAIWIAFAFGSDGSVNRPDGVFVDDVVLQKGMVNVPPAVSSFASPGPSPRGLAFDGANLWCSDAANDRIYKVTATGRVASSFASPSSNPTGLAWDGTDLWNADSNTDRIYKLSTSGATLSSFAAPASNAAGLAWHGAGLWHSDFGVDTIWKLGANGNILSSFAAPGTWHQDLAWDGQNLWLADAEALLIYKMAGSGNILDYYLAPGTYPTGLEWDGANLCLADANQDLIYKLRLQPVANDVGVTTIDLPNAVFLGSAIPVGVVVKNSGTLAQSNFPLSYTINNGPAITENFVGTLAPGTSATKVFATLWTPAAEGTYRISAWTALTGDVYAANDTLPTPKQVRVVKPASVELPPPKSLAIISRQATAVMLQWSTGVFTRPIAGKWSGTNVEDGESMSFFVNNSGTAVDSFKLSWRLTISGCPTVSGTTSLPGSLTIVNNNFSSGTTASGNFTLPEMCSGNFGYTIPIPIPGCNVTARVNRTWKASPQLPKPTRLGFKLYRDTAPGVKSTSDKLIQFIQNPNATSFADNTATAGVTYYYILTAQYDAGESVPSNEALITSVHAREVLPSEFSLSQNYPNPFNPTTTIAYALPQTEQVELKVYDLHGHEVGVLVNEKKVAGKYTVEFDATTLPTGVYFYQLRAGEFMATKKLILLR